jgi:hypothetical protein
MIYISVWRKVGEAGEEVVSNFSIGSQEVGSPLEVGAVINKS